MLTLVRRYSVLVACACALFVSLGLLVANSRGSARIDPLGFLFLELTTPVARLLSAASSAIGGAWRGYVDLVGVGEEREWLRHRVRELEEQSDSNREVALENERLRGLLDLRAGVQSRTVAARITSVGSSGLFRTALLDKGEAGGIRQGMAVLADAGVVGRVVATSAHAARVLLIVDPSSGVDAIVQRTRARGIVEGASGSGARLKYVQPREELHPGDLVITSGLDGIFPKGVRIGRIAGPSAERSGLFQMAEIQPTVDFGRLEDVLVVEAPEREAPPAQPPAGAPEPDDEDDKEGAGGA